MIKNFLKIVDGIDLIKNVELGEVLFTCVLTLLLCFLSPYFYSSLLKYLSCFVGLFIPAILYTLRFIGSKIFGLYPGQEAEKKGFKEQFNKCVFIYKLVQVFCSSIYLLICI